MSAPLLAVWFGGLLGVLVWSIWLARRARLARGAHLVPRTAVALGALLVGLLGTLAAHVWGTDPASRGMTRIADARPGGTATATTAPGAGDGQPGGDPGHEDGQPGGGPRHEDGPPGNQSGDGEEGPPRARLFVRYVQMRLDTTAPAASTSAPAGATAARSAVIGYSPHAALRLPRSYGLDESRQGWDLLQVAIDGPQGLSVSAIDGAPGHPEPTTTRVMVHAAPRPDADAPAPDALARHGDALMAAHGCAGPSSGDASGPPGARLDGPGAIYAILCAGDAPHAALVLERDLAGAEAGDVPVRVVPLVWRARHWRPHHIQIGSGSLIQIGTMADALPGVTLWEVPAPAGRAELFYPPADILAPCAEWLSGRHGEGFFSLPLGMRPAAPAGMAGPAVDDSALCVLPFTPPFGLEVRRLLPDVPGVRGRSLWAVGLAITPAVLALLALAAQARSSISARRFARLLVLGWLSALWAAMSVWRLLWAHRIDMLRDYESVGSRVLANQVAAVLAGAALAATCAALWVVDRDRDATAAQPARPWRAVARGMLLSGLAWLAWLVVGSAALRGDTAALPFTAGLLGHALMSLAVGTAPVWLPHAWRALAALAQRHLGGHAGRSSDNGDDGDGGDGGGRRWLRSARLVWTWPWSAAILMLAVVAAVAVVTAVLAPRAVALKLGLAWLFPFALYAALRSAVTMSGPTLLRALITLAAAGAGMLALAGLDPGVTAVIALPGALVALLLCSHDACFGEGALRQLHGYQRQLAPLVTAHALLLGGAGLVVAVLCVSGLAGAAAGEPDASTARTITRGAMHLALFAAFLFVAAAGQAYLRRGLRPAVPWLVAATLLAGLWLVRAPLVDRVLESSAQAAHRLAIVLDPGYALLHSENKFLAGLTAWRETVVPGGTAGAHSAASAHPVLDGQGYFGAQLIDPGVLLSIENDYFPVLLLRETGTLGILATALLAWLLTAGAWALASARFRHGSAAQRTRVLGAVLLAAVCLYQPLAALGALPLTGVAWPGFGLDSPSDQWVFLALALWLLVWEPRDAPMIEGVEGVDGGDGASGPDSARARQQLERFDVELRGSRVFRRVRTATVAAAVLVALAGMLVLARSAAFALRRPNPVDAEGQAVPPFDGLVRAVDYAYHLQCPWPHRVAPAPATADAAGGATEDAAGALVPADLLGEPDAPGVIRFHDALRASWRDQRELAVDALRRFLGGDDAACGSADSPVQRGAWRFERSPEAPGECRMRWKLGWPEVELAITRAPGPDATSGGDGGAGTVSDLDPAAGDLDQEPAPESDGGSVDAAGAGDAPADTVSAHSARCSIELRTDVLRVLRFPARRPYRDARIRLVSRAMGAAALDRGELVSGHLAVRLRPGAGAIDVAHARAGLYAGHEVRISPELTIVLGGDDGGHAILRRTAQTRAPGATAGAPGATAGAPGATAGAPAAPPSAPTGAEPDSWLFVREPPPARVRVLAAEEGTWKLMPPEIAEMPLDRLTLIVVGGPDARSLWLFRPPRPWSEAAGDAAAGAAVVDPLLADDITTVRGERRRHYLYGGLLPELGWVNPFHGRMSLGLDGWVRVATAEYERTPRPGDDGPRVWLDDGREVPYCGTLAAAMPGATPATTDTEATAATVPTTGTTTPARAGTRDAPDLGRVCRHSALDGVLECRVSLQPELAVRLRHLTELVSLAPERFGGAGSAASLHAGYVLLRGDTGEIVAQGELVPGRASTAYAPATPEIEQVLVRLREDRDPATGRRLPPEQRGEASAEKIDWGQPIAVGSTMKPFLARALELAAPDFAAGLTLAGAPTAGAECASGRTNPPHALLGHCPPTDSLWNHHGSYDLAGFLSASVNWFQGAIGLLGTAVPGGAWGFGEDTAEAWDGQPGPDPSALALGNAGSHAPDRALWTSYQGRRVVSARGTVDLAALRRTPMWQRFEELLGRPLCMLGSKDRCRQAHAMRDLCAMRALPIDQPTRDLRHLVALGPSAFDFYPPLADPARHVGPGVRTREYLQFLRGSGLHPLGSLAQSADAFNRLIYEPAGDAGPAGTPEAPGGYRLAASWFPVLPSGNATGNAPATDCRASAGGGVTGGLCDVLRTGTARGLRDLLDDARFTFHGAKTGTIDSLADIVESSEACAQFRTGHTVTDRPARDSAQPYWLPCERQSPPEVNDSLLLISLTVHTPAGDVPLTLGLRFQRSGPSFATRVARHYLDVVHAYFAPGNAGPRAGAGSPRTAE
jgi:hypothetical protein